MQKSKFIFLVLILLLWLGINIYAAEEPAPEPKDTKLASIPEGYQVRDTISGPDKNAAYILFKKDKEDGRDKFYVFFDGRLGKPYDRVKDVVFSPDGKRMAYAAKKGEKEYFVLDGRESKPYGSV